MATSKKKRVENGRKILAKFLEGREVIASGRDDFPEFLDRLHAALVYNYLPEHNVSELDRMVGVLGRLTGFDPALNSGRLHAFAKDMLAAGYEVEEIETLYSLDDPNSPWCLNWRSGKGVKQTPSESAIRETIKGFVAQAIRRGGSRSVDDL